MSGAAAVRFDISRFVVEGNTLLPAAEVDAVLAPFTGSNRDFGDVQRALKALQAGYAKRGFNLVRVALPEQELDAGVVRFKVVETRIGQVDVEGNRFFDTANIRRSLPELREGATPNVLRLSASLAQANDNPAKKTTLQLKDGTRDGEVDARIVVVDDKPWTVGLNADNTGNPSTGRTLVGIVYQNADIAGLDHVLGLQYTTTAQAPERVSVYGIGYHAPIYTLGDSFDAYASYSDVDSGTVLAGISSLQVNGRGTMFGARYNHSFGTTGPLESLATLGFDQKAFRNGVTFEGAPLGNDVTVRPLSLAYAGTWKSGPSTTVFTLTGVRNLPGGDRGSSEDFASVRANAPANYALLRYSLAHVRALAADWQFRLVATGQYSRDPLVPGEQFGAGGLGSVRGFETRELAGDKGYSGSVELYTPNLCARVPGAAVFCRALVFYDGARVTSNDPLPGEFSSASIGSVGAGLRAAVGTRATLQLDLGHVVDAGFVSTRGHNQLNFKLGVTY